MTRTTILHSALTCLLIAASATTAAAQEPDPIRKRLEQSPRHHEFVRIDTEAGRSVRALIVYPEVDRSVPAVVVIHENRGLTDFERGVADQIAEAGYVAIAPDLLSQTGPDGGDTDSFESRDAAREGIYRLTPEQVTADLDATVAHARSLEASNDKVAVSGFCWGGGQAFGYAAYNPEVAATFVFYGSAPEEEVLGRITSPVYGFYGGNDFRITGQVPEVERAMEAAGKDFEPEVYEGAGHGFVRSGEMPGASEADQQGREQAWERIKELLGKL